MNNIDCPACKKNLEDENCIKCSLCSENYHAQCVNITSGDFKSFTIDKIKSWVCPACQLKQKRSGDNSKTPVGKRIQTSKSDTVEIDNVTLRVKTSKTQSCVSNGRNLGPNTKPSNQEDSTSQKLHEHQCLTKEDIREIIQTEIRNAFSVELKDLIKQIMSPQLQAMRSEVGTMKTEIDSLKDSVEFMSGHFELAKSENLKNNKICDLLEKELTSVKNTNKELTNRLNEMEQQSRACNIEVQCVPEHRSENLITTVLQLARTVSCDVREEDIHLCTRTAKLDSNSSRPRSIIVKPKSPKERDALLASVIKFNKSNRNEMLNTGHLGIGGDKKSVYVVEHLSPINKQLHKATRMAAKKKQYKYVWVRGGRIFVRKSETTQAIVMKDLDSIKRL